LTEPAPPPSPPSARPETDRFLVAWALYGSLVLLVFVHQLFPELGARGVIATEGMLAAELHASEEGGPWGLGLLEPYCYRPLFRALVLAVWGALGGDGDTFHGVFVCLSALSLLGAAWAFDVLLRALGFASREAMLGVTLFLLGFPVLFAYDIPIHTREDLLGYAWIALTLLFVARDQPAAVALLGAVGVTIRETCLLGVLPFALVSRRPWPQRLLAYAPGLVAWLGVRVVQAPPGGADYAYVQISTAPLFEFPVEAALYLFATFGALWVAAALRLLDPTPPRHALLAPRVALSALAAVALTGWTMGMIREARITYVLFPFVVPLALDFFLSARARAVLRSRAALAAALVVLGLGAAGIMALAASPEERIPPLRTVIGDSFNPGVIQILEVPTDDGETFLLDEPVFASRLNGPFALLHLAAAVGLVAGWFATRPARPAA
jgi:hypothetical protein